MITRRTFLGGSIAGMVMGRATWDSDWLANLDQRISAIMPTPEEDAFLQVPWRTNLNAARVESIRTGKPLFVWEMNGHPLCHT